MNTVLKRIFSPLADSYLETPVAIRTAVLRLRDEIISNHEKIFFSSNNKLQDEAMKKSHSFNTKAQSLCMSFVEIDKGENQGARAIVSEMLLKSGTLTEESGD
jgi:hypothetical protein